MIQPTDSAVEMMPINAAYKATLVKTIPTKSQGETSIHVTQDYVYLGCSNLKVKIFSLKDFQEIQTMTAYSSKVKCMWVCQNYLFSGQQGEQGIIKVWDTRSYNLIRVLKGHTDTIQMITGLNKNLIFSASSDGSVKGWDITKPDEVIYNLEHQYPVLVVKCINKDLIVSGGDGCLLIVWQWAKQIKLKTLFAHACSLTCLVLKDKQLISAGGDGTVRFWDIDQLTDQNSSPQFSDQKKRLQIKISDNAIDHCCLFKGELVFIDDDNKIFIVTGQGSYQIEADIPYYEMVTGVSSIGNQLVVTTNTHDARIFDIKPKYKSEIA